MKCTRICLRMSRDTQADYKSMKPYIDIATLHKSDNPPKNSQHFAQSR